MLKYANINISCLQFKNTAFFLIIFFQFYQVSFLQEGESVEGFIPGREGVSTFDQARWTHAFLIELRITNSYTVSLWKRFVTPEID